MPTWWGGAYVDPALNRGRGAQTNKTSRFDKESREAFDDGWGQVEDLKPFETIEHVERARTIITRNESPDIGFDRSINAYRGCEHGCSYCFARPTHAYLGHSAGLDFERDIYVKVNAVELLRRELADKRYGPKPIAMGTNTDPYQPAERKHKLTRGHPATAARNAASGDDHDQVGAGGARPRYLEADGRAGAGAGGAVDHQHGPQAQPQDGAARLDAGKAAGGDPAAVGGGRAGVGVMAAPMIPAINDMELERILDAAAAQGARDGNAILLRLPGEVRDIFREWLLRHYPDRVGHVMSLVREARGGKDNDPNFGTRFIGEGAYAVLLRQRLEKARERYGLNKPTPPLRIDLFVPPRVDDGQMNLF